MAALHALLALMVVLPIACVRVPLLGDYLNHLARIAILSRIDHDPFLQRYYLDEWKFVPYFGMDLPVLFLARFMSIYAAGRLFVCLCVLMPAAACAVLHYTLHQRASLVPLAAYLLCYNYLLARGFLNYLFSAGLAVMLFAAWVATAGWPNGRRAALFALACAGLYLSHAFAFVAYGVLVAGYEAGRLARAPLARGRLADLAAASAQALPTLALAWWTGADGMVSSVTHTLYGAWPVRVADLLSPLYFPGGTWINALYAFVPLLLLLAARRIGIDRAVLPAAALTGIAVCATPHVLMNLWGADLRFPLLFVLVLIGAASFRMPARAWQRRLFGTVVVALVGLRAIDAYRVLWGLDRQVASVRRTLASLPEGARLLVVDADPAAPGRLVSPMITGHLGMVAAIDRDAFVPFLFTVITAVQVRPAYRDTASPVSFEITLAQLRANTARTGGPPPPYGYGGWMYWVDWPETFDDVLIIHFGEALDGLPASLRLVASGDVANLYAIAR